MQRSDDRILTTHVGSLVRPASLHREPGAPPPDDAVLRAAVEDVVRRQVAVGLDVINDGEFGKSSWSNYILERISGFDIRPDRPTPAYWLGSDRERFAEAIGRDMPIAVNGLPTEHCVRPIEYRDASGLERDIANLRHAVTLEKPAEIFMTSVAPASTAFNGVNEYYASDEEYVFAIAGALRREYRAIHEAGFLLQVDDAVLANMYDHLVQSGGDEHYRRWAELRIAALNHALEGIPPETVRYHVCFGSWHVPHVSDAPLEAIVDLVLQVNAGAYSIEAANARHEHEWRVWEKRELPAGKILIPGVVTHHTATVEHPRLVADRIVRYAKLVGRENVVAGTDCGFAQTEQIARVHSSVMWAKLEALAEGARIASRELWGGRET
jgi:5-methyltetrahydropteroyltriglutamate--homocysteine methyltransferase